MAKTKLTARKSTGGKVPRKAPRSISTPSRSSPSSSGSGKKSRLGRSAGSVATAEIRRDIENKKWKEENAVLGKKLSSWLKNETETSAEEGSQDKESQEENSQEEDSQAQEGSQAQEDSQAQEGSQTQEE